MQLLSNAIIDANGEDDDKDYRYTYVMNNPLMFTDPSGYMPQMFRDMLDEYYRNGGGGTGFDYFAGYNASGVYDPYHMYRSFHDRFPSAENVGRFSRDPGPTGVHFIDGDKYYSYQDPVSGKNSAYLESDAGDRIYQDENGYYQWKTKGQQYLAIRSINGIDYLVWGAAAIGFTEYVDPATNGGGDNNK